jgi:hypothetical protein
MVEEKKLAISLEVVSRCMLFDHGFEGYCHYLEKPERKHVLSICKHLYCERCFHPEARRQCREAEDKINS